MQHNNQLNQTSDLEFLTQLNILLASEYDFSKNINSALKLIGEHTGYDRVHVLEIRRNMSLSILYEWCRQNITPIKERIEEKNFFFDQQLDQQLYANNYITINTTTELSNSELITLLAEHSSKNVIVFPLFGSGYQFAFLAFTQCNPESSVEKNDTKLLTTLATLIANGLNKNILEKKLVHQLAQIQKNKESKELLRIKLLHVNQNIQETWNQIKSLQTAPKDSFLTDKLEQHIKSLDKLCQTLIQKPQEQNQK